jgi:hypothetical protein
MDAYGSLQLAVDGGAALQSAATSAADPIGALQRLGAHGAPHTIDISDGIFVGKRVHRYLQHSYAYSNTPDNHLQGIQRVGNYLLISAADWTEPAAHLFVVALTPGANGQLQGRLERVLALSNETPHPGGFQVYGDVAPIALEGEGGVKSQVIFLNVADPANPRLLADWSGAPLIIKRDDTKASATAITALPDGRFLLGVYYRSEIIDFYLSLDDDIRAGFSGPVTRKLKRIGNTRPDYQSIVFARCEEADEGVRIWMLGTRHGGKASNYVQGPNIAEITSFYLDGDCLFNWPDVEIPEPMSVAGRQFTFDDKCGNFAAAASVSIEPNGDFTLYAAHHWREGGTIRFSVCS